MNKLTRIKTEKSYNVEIKDFLLNCWSHKINASLFWCSKALSFFFFKFSSNYSSIS